MNKLAVFVEGQTEQLFVSRFVKELAGHHKVAIETWKAVGGGRRPPRRFIQLSASATEGKQYSVLIYDSGTDSRVTSDIRDQYQGLVRGGYSLVLGLRDVHPQPRAQIPAMRRSIERVLPKGKVRADVVLAIMEIEAWFIAEDTHFARMDAGITAEKVKDVIGADMRTLDVEALEQPSEILDRIYKVVGRAYRKRRKRISNLLDVLDYARLYLAIPERVGALRRFRDHLDSFLSPEAVEGA